MKLTGIFDMQIIALQDKYTTSLSQHITRSGFIKRYYGELDGTSKGEILSAEYNNNRSSGIVAIEQFKGSLGNVKGSFLLQHYSIKSNEKDKLIIRIVPDSGTNELKSIEGFMSVLYIGGEYFYELTYKNLKTH